MSKAVRTWRCGLLAATLGFILNASSVPAAEGRAVWIHAGMFSPDRGQARAELIEALGAYQATGLSTIFCFDSLMAQHRKGWDFLAILADEAHRRGMTVHPVICPGRNVRVEGEIKDHPEWLIRSMTGEAFKKEFGQTPLEIAHDSGSMAWCEWIRWNAGQATTLVRGVRDLLRSSPRPLMLSAAVFPDHVAARVEIGQDWARRAEDGLVDVLCPMLYTNDAGLFRAYIGEAVRAAKGRSRVYAGIACVPSHNRNTPDGVVRQVAIAREEGAAGVTFFSGNSLGPEFRMALASAAFGGASRR